MVVVVMRGGGWSSHSLSVLSKIIYYYENVEMETFTENRVVVGVVEGGDGRCLI